MNWNNLKKHCEIDGEDWDACWEWCGRLTPQGYPATDRKISQSYLEAKTGSLHVAVAMEHPEWKDGSCARHGCDSKKCVSPHHVVPGTHSENMIDRVVSGNQNTAVLTPEDVFAIRKSSKTRAELAKEFSCSQSTIKKVKCGYTWKFLVEESA